MTVILTFYITQPQNFEATKQLVARIHAECNIHSALFTNLQTPQHPEFRNIPNLELVIPNLINSHLHTILSDSIIDVNNPNVVAGFLNFKQQSMSFNGKTYSFKPSQDDLPKFTVDLIKLRGDATPTGIQFNEQMYIFSASDEIRYTTITKTPVKQWFHNQQPSLWMNWNFSDSKEFCKAFMRLTKDVQLTHESNKASHVVVVNQTNQLFPPENVLYFMMEPHGERLYSGYIQAMMSKGQPLYFGSHEHHLNLGEWHLSWNLAQFEREVCGFEKTKGNALSVVVSGKRADPGHIYRLDLIRKLDNYPNLPFALDIYGHCAELKFKNYRGELPSNTKNDGMFPYKYHFQAENNYIDNYITEKLYDGMMAECLTFYKGAPNVTTFFSSDSFVQMSGDIDKDIQTIITTITSNAYEKALPAIKEGKRRVITRYGFEPRIKGILKVVNTACAVVDPSVMTHLHAQGFKNVQMAPVPLNFYQLVQQHVMSGEGLYVKLSSEHIPNEFDRLGFASVEHPDADGYVFKALNIQEPFDVFLTPKGMEQILINASTGQPHPFIGLKIVQM